MVVLPGVSAADDDAARPPRLLGRAVLPVADGRSRSAVRCCGDRRANGVDFPIEEGQIVEGFSGIVEGDRPGQFLAMADNGFGNKANSADFLLRAYVVEPDFKTADGGSGRSRCATGSSSVTRTTCSTSRSSTRARSAGC